MNASKDIRQAFVDSYYGKMGKMPTEEVSS